MNRKKKKINLLFVVFLFVLFWVYLSVQHTDLSLPIYADEGDHLIRNLRYYEILINPSMGMFEQLLEVSNHYPPLFHLSAAILNIFFGPSREISVKANMIYFLVMMLSIYFIGKKIGSKKTGSLAAFILSMFPMVFGMSKWFMLEFSLTAMVTLSICFLLYSEGFTKRNYSLLFGLSLGLGMLTKWTFGAFIIGPFVCVLLSKDRKNFCNLIYSITGGLSISLIWYLRHAHYLIGIIPAGNIRISFLEFPWYTLDGLLFYARSIFFYQISPLFLFFFLISLPLFFKTKIQGKSILLCWVFISYIVLTALDNKWPHYIMPVLPAIAIITASGLLALPVKILRHSIIFTLIIAGSIQFWHIYNFGYATAYAESNKFYAENAWEYVGYLKGNYWDERKKINRIIAGQVSQYIKEASLKKEKVVIGIIVYDPTVETAIKYLIVKNKWQNVEEVVSFSHETHRFFKLKKYFDFLIIRSSGQLWPNKDDIAEMFKAERLDKLRDLNAQNYKEYAEAIKKMGRKFGIEKIVRINHSRDPEAYFYFLVPDNSYQKENFFNQKQIEKRKTSISKGPLRVLFYHGRARVYYEGIELTKSDGINIVFSFDGQNYYPGQANWQVEKIDNQKIIAKGRWPDLPLTQIWQLEIDGKGQIDWKVNMQIDDEVKIKRWRSSLMLSGKYEEWISLDEISKFGDDLSDARVVLRDLASRYIGVKKYKGKKAMPAVIFKTDLNSTESIPVINFSRKERGLCFHNVKEGSGIFPPGKYSFFSGRIMFTDEKKVEEYIKKTEKKKELERKKM